MEEMKLSTTKLLTSGPSQESETVPKIHSFADMYSFVMLPTLVSRPSPGSFLLRRLPRDRDRDRQTDRQTDRQRGREREGERERGAGEREMLFGNSVSIKE